MNRFFKIVPLPILLFGLLAGVAVAFVGKPYVYWATSGYSQESFLFVFSSEPSEEMFLDAVIYKEPLIQDKFKTTQQWRHAQSEESRLKIKLDNHRSVVISPYSTDQDPDTVFADGGRVKGIWLTEPSTRIHFPMVLVRSSYFLCGLVGSVAAVLFLQWLWYFVLVRLRELSQAIRGD